MHTKGADPFLAVVDLRPAMSTTLRVTWRAMYELFREEMDHNVNHGSQSFGLSAILLSSSPRLGMDCERSMQLFGVDLIRLGFGTAWLVYWPTRCSNASTRTSRIQFTWGCH